MLHRQRRHVCITGGMGNAHKGKLWLTMAFMASLVAVWRCETIASLAIQAAAAAAAAAAADVGSVAAVTVAAAGSVSRPC